MHSDAALLQKFLAHTPVREGTVVQCHDVPDVIRSVSAMARPSYVDLFAVAANGAAESSSEQWTRAAVEKAAGLGGQFVWRVLCGLRLESHGAEDRVGGWKLADRGDRWLRLEAASWFMTAHIVVLVGDDEVSVATFIHYDRPTGALLWPGLAVAHRALMPGLLRATAHHIRRGRRARAERSPS
jgi:hypothetical protein